MPLFLQFVLLIFSFLLRAAFLLFASFLRIFVLQSFSHHFIRSQILSLLVPLLSLQVGDLLEVGSGGLVFVCFPNAFDFSAFEAVCFVVARTHLLCA